ncbi:transposase [Cellulomonas oligotrophica]|uniref:transposase n=1 Tax=Cellulomonas oligotrophica TaxID=931536 RepID=UPI0023B297E2|nr:transposase [Cellulomonas oligotrophica]
MKRVLRRPGRPRPLRGPLVTLGAHHGPVDAIGANLPRASWRRCRTHCAANRISTCPRRHGRPSSRCTTRSMTSPTQTPPRCSGS